ncbi:MAG: MBL fold metallo-hydrolase [Candidatus Komeilibacteria bacterium]|nr:MBL fold metallo-hydrolase [Candidatus Komeilibacteria bacterium]
MKKTIKILTGLLTSLLVLSSIVWQSSQSLELKIYFFNIGQGDGMLIRTPTHENIVIDGGPDNSFLSKLGQTLPFYDRTIDLMVLTHPHADHLTGLIPVLERYKVKRVLTTGVVYQSSAYNEWLKLVNQEQAEVIYAQAGQKLIFGQVEFLVMAPLKNYHGQTIAEKGGEWQASDNGGNLNNTSVVIKMIYQQNSALFAGDLEIDGEAGLLASGQEVKADLLKVGHHGSDTATGHKFLAKVSPKYAVIQVGQQNKFGLPDFRVINLLTRQGVKIYRNDQHGDLTLTFNGQEIIVD